MSRITEKERARFHKILDDVIDIKLNSDKNSKKTHWESIGIGTLNKMNMVEAHELDLSVYSNFNFEIESECYDNIAIPLFIIDNLRDNK